MGKGLVEVYVRLLIDRTRLPHILPYLLPCPACLVWAGPEPRSGDQYPPPLPFFPLLESEETGELSLPAS